MSNQKEVSVKKNLLINISDSGKRFPLMVRPDGQHLCSLCGLQLNLKTGELTDFIDEGKGVFDDDLIRFNVGHWTMRAGLLALSSRYKDFFQEILDTHAAGEQVDHLIDDFRDEWENESVMYQVRVVDVKELLFGASGFRYEFPLNKFEFDKIVEDLINYDGAVGYYMDNPTQDNIKEQLLDCMIGTHLNYDDYVSQLIIERSDFLDKVSQKKESTITMSFQKSLNSFQQSEGFKRIENVRLDNENKKNTPSLS